jgi:hypothetical protein
MWIPKVIFDALVSLGPKFENIERGLRAIEGNTGILHTLQRNTEDVVAAVRLQHTAAEIVALKVADDVRELVVDRSHLAALEGENQGLRARVVQQETTIKLLLTQLELSGARESAIFAHLGVAMRLPVQTFVAGSPTTHPIAPAGVTDAHGTPAQTHLAAEDTLKVLQSQIRSTQGSSAPAPAGLGTPGTLPDDMFADLDDAAADAPAADVPPSV